MKVHETTAEGAMVYWNAAPTERQRLLDEMTKIGLAEHAPCERTEAASLKMALEEFIDDAIAERRSSRMHNTTQDGEKVRRDKIVQPLRNQKENGFEVVDVTRKDSNNEYVVDFAAKIVDGQVVISRGYASQSKIQKKYEIYRATLGGSAVGGALISLIKVLGGITMRESGGVYWLTSEKLERWEEIADTFERAGDNEIEVVRTVLDVRTARAITKGISEEVLKHASELTKEICSGEIGPDAIANRLVKAKSLHARVSEYEGILGQTMQNLHDCIKVAEMAANQAVSIREADDVFAGAFASV